jgi:capsule polysaccharide export protein KpsE/RkpR
MTATGGRVPCTAGVRVARGRVAGGRSAVVIVAFLAGCSSAATSGTGTSTATSGASASASASASDKAAVCASAGKLKDDVVALKDVNIRANGTSAVSAQLTKIQQQLGVVKSDAQGQFAPQITGLQNAVSTLSSSLSAATGNLNGGTLTTLAAAVGAVVTAGNSLVSAISGTC